MVLINLDQLKIDAKHQDSTSRLIVQHNADQRTVNVHATAVVVDESQLPEPVHEEADA